MQIFKGHIIRKPQIEDAKEICEVFIESVSTLCSSYYSPEEIAYWNSNKKPEKIQKWIENQNLYFLVSQVEDRISGVGFIDYKTGELYACYLRPEAIGIGLGKKLLELMILEAKRNTLTKVFLKASLNAKSFYERQGFKVISSHLDRKPPDGVPNYTMELLL